MASPSLNAALPRGLHADFGNIKLTTISDTVYNADGTLAKGYLVISWPAFTTATQAVVAAGSLSIRLGPDGLFIGRLAPTTGSTPTGVYYTVVYQLEDGSSKQEYWAVPDTDNTTISAVRAKLMPTSTAAQFLTRDLADSVYVHVNDDQIVGGVKTFTKSPVVPDPQKATDTVNKEYADAAYVHLNDNQTIGGVKTFSRSPVVPDPQNPTEVANKEYVDANAGGGANLDSPPPIGTKTPNMVEGTHMISKVTPTIDVRAYGAKCDGASDDSAALQAAITAAETVSSNNSVATIFTPPGKTCIFGTSLNVLATGDNSMDIGGNVGPELWNSGGIWVYTGSSDAIRVNASGLGNGLSFHLHNFRIDCNTSGVSSNTCQSLVSIGKSFGPIYIDHMFLQGNHTTKSGAGSHGGVSAIKCADTCGLQVNFTDNLLTNFSGPLIAVHAGTNITLRNNQMYDAPVGIAIAGSAPVDIGDNYFELITHGIEITNNAYWTFGQYNIHDNQFNLEAIPPNGNVTNSGEQRCLYVSNTTGAVVMGAKIDFRHNQCNESDGYVFGNKGLAPYGVEFNMTPANGFQVVLDAQDNYFAGMTTSAIYSNSVFVTVMPDWNNLVTSDFQPYEPGSNLPTFSGWYRIGSIPDATINSLTGTTATYQSIYANSFFKSPLIYASDGASGHGYMSCLSGDGTHSGYCAWFNPSNMRTFTLGYDSGNDLTLTANNGGNFNVASGLTANSVAVAGDLTARDIPGHAYFVSKYSSIQAAINAAYGSGTVSGAVIDDRTAAYGGPGFYIPDSVKVQLAPVPYMFTSAVTRNNGNNNVTAAIVVEQGAHLAGGGTSSNHGTTITVGNGFANDIIATTSVGTGTGAGVQWWHWGSIENLNVNGANQTAGECVHVENMGETSKVHDLLVKNCFGNNIEFVGAAATQSDIANLSTSRSRNGSGVRFTNLAGVGKINGLSGDCNAGSLLSVQENAAGTLTITGLKSEAESTICANGSSQDPAILLDTLAGLNTHVHVIGGYAFGTSQNALVKVVGSGGGIFEMEGFYVTGYTNLINDTTRSVVVPSTSSNSKQPFFYEPNGIVFANQAFTLTPGTGVMGGSTAITPIFYATTGNATMVASLGNGDGQSIMAGGIELAGQNRVMYGATPEVMARAGYRFTGSGYDTTKWDFVPAWNAGDATEKNLGNSLNVCQKNGSVSCRWSNVYSHNVDTESLTVGGKPVVASQHVIAGTMAGTSGAITGNGSYQPLFTFSLPAGTFTVGTVVTCSARWTHNSGGSNAINFQWKLGNSSYTAQTLTSAPSSNGVGRAELEIYTPSSLGAQNVITLPAQQGGQGPQTGHADTSSENLANPATLTFSFNVANTDAVTPIAAYCSAIQ